MYCSSADTLEDVQAHCLSDCTQAQYYTDMHAAHTKRGIAKKPQNDRIYTKDAQVRAPFTEILLSEEDILAEALNEVRPSSSASLYLLIDGIGYGTLIPQIG